MSREKKTWRYKVRPIWIEGDVAFIPLSDGTSAIIDARDAECVRPWNWAPSRHGDSVIVRRSLNPGYQCLADAINPPPLGMINDHRDGDPRNNRRSNLRFVSQQANSRNRRKVGVRSRFKGVQPHHGNWRVRIQVGSFTDEEAAAAAYDRAARALFGEHAALNFPEDDERGALTSP